jgi:ribonuclease BN (tRNA processing enzyme)
MQVTVLGCNAAFPRAGGACSGFLVDGGGAKVWIDAGNGTFSNLQKVASWRDLDAMIITHGHADHISDMLPLMYAMGLDDNPPDEPLPVHAPGEVEQRLKALLGGGRSSELFAKVFAFQPLNGAFRVKDLDIRPFRTDHPIDCYGLRLAAGGHDVVYTSDTAYFPDLTEACAEADLLIAEATYVGDVGADGGVHMWARETGRLARDAKVKRLVLTHIWATFDPAEAVAEARESYDGPLEAAIEGGVYTV